MCLLGDEKTLYIVLQIKNTHFLDVILGKGREPPFFLLKSAFMFNITLSSSSLIYRLLIQSKNTPGVLFTFWSSFAFDCWT